MKDIPLYLHFLYSFMATIGFSLFFNVPKKSIHYTGMTGAIGWTIYIYMNTLTDGPIFANFIASCIVAILGEVFARIDKKPVIVFVIPGIIPLVPGLGMYNTMAYFIQENYDLAISTGITTALVAGAISLALILASSIAKSFKSINAKKVANN
jgi:uncharacterized membrane protein YjjB (DUF3815 family)